MSQEQTAQPTFYMAPTCTRDLAVSFVKTLVSGELLTGTPTVTISSGGPTISGASVNSAALQVEDPSTPHYALAGQAVTFRATASTITPGTYTVTITCATSGGQVMPGYATIVVQGS